MSVSDRAPLSANGHRAVVRALLLSTALTSVGGVGAAYAADKPAKETSTAAVADSGQVSQVVVTARRREENLQSTPVAVTAISGVQAAELNIRNFQDLRGTVPNLEVLPMGNGGANLTIRGIGQANFQVNADQKTGFYFNEMYVARQEGNQLYFYDVDSLQVLKGPQGTLFGKNTTAGAFLLNSARPQKDAGGYLNLRLGNFKRIDTEGAINAPLSDKVLTRFSFRTENEDGFINHLLDKEKSNNVNDKSARFQIRLLPTERFTVDLLTEFNKSQTNGQTSVPIGCRAINSSYVPNYNATHAVPYCSAYPLLSQKDGYLVYGGATLNILTSAILTDLYRGGDYNSANIPGASSGGHRNPFGDQEVKTANLRLSYELTDKIALKSITAMRRSTSVTYNPTDNTPNDIYAQLDNTATSQFTQEFNLNGKAIDNRLNYVLGAFYYDQKTHFIQQTGPDWIDPTGYWYDANNHFKSYAFYGQASFKIIDPLELTVGARYSHDQKNAVSHLEFKTISTGVCAAGNGRTGFVNAFIAGRAACNGLLYGAGNNEWHSFDPRVQLSYQFTRDIFLYGSITKGYNAGGFNQQLGFNLPGSGLISYNPEKLKSYEVGLKTEFWDRRARFNIDYFLQKYTDIQTSITVTYSGVTTRAIQTGATAHEAGIETEFELRPIPDLVLRANAAYLRQHYETINPTISPSSFILTTPVNATPKFTYSLSARYTWRLEGGRRVVGNLDWRAVGRRPACTPLSTGLSALAPGQSCAIPAYGLLGGRLEFTPSEDSPWNISLWGTNLLNARYQIGRAIGGGMGIDSITPGRPREYGFEIRRTF
jgi:iron complex outermembrane receptor protein